MAKDIYEDIAKRTGGDIYIGVVAHGKAGHSQYSRRIQTPASSR